MLWFELSHHPQIKVPSDSLIESLGFSIIESKEFHFFECDECYEKDGIQSYERLISAQEDNKRFHVSLPCRSSAKIAGY
jgi:hypothetical protein